MRKMWENKIKISLGMSLQPQERGPPTLTGGLLESETEPRELWAEFVFHCASTVSFAELVSCCAWPLHTEVLSARLNLRHATIDVRRV